MKHSTYLRSLISFAEHRLYQLIGMALLLTMLLAGSVCYGQDTTPTNTTAVAPEDVLSSYDPHKDIQNLMAHYKVTNFAEVSDLEPIEMFYMWNNFVQFLVQNPNGSYLTHPEIVTFRDKLWGYVNDYAPKSFDRTSYAKLVELSNKLAQLDFETTALKNETNALKQRDAELEKEKIATEKEKLAVKKKNEELRQVARMMGIKVDD